MSREPRALPSLAGRTVVVTGGNAGIGYFVSEQLAEAGARVVIAARSAEKARTAMASIRARVPGAELEHVRLDLLDLSSVRDAAAALAAHGPVHALVDNAGLIVTPRRRTATPDGIEVTIAGNFLGHFALAAQLMPALAPDARVVGLGSLSTAMSRLRADDLWSERSYARFRAYAASKHAVQLFGFELARRFAAAGSARRSLVAHPGWATSAYASRRPGITDRDPLKGRFFETLTGWVGQGKDRGARAAVLAVADPDAPNGGYIGPRLGLAGAPVWMPAPSRSLDPEIAARLWADAEERAGVRFEV